MITDSDGKPGLRMETAASITARDMIRQHMGTFSLSIRTDRAASAATTAAYIDGLAGCIALTIAGGHGFREEIINAVVEKLRDCVTRDLSHLKRT